MPMTSKEMVKFLKKNGFIDIPCGNGSHRKLLHPNSGRTITVPYHNKDLRKGTEQAILKQAGLK